MRLFAEMLLAAAAFGGIGYGLGSQLAIKRLEDEVAKWRFYYGDD
jgi:hypothetical protein